MPLCRLLVRVRDAQELRFLEGPPEQLQANRQTLPVQLREAAGQRDAAVTGEVGGDGEDVGQVHAHRVVAAFADIGTMTDERWAQTFKAASDLGLAPKDLDVKKAYTLQFLPQKPK